ncbi:hypothetical protein RJO15_22755 [Herbaspirillum huttiense F1]|uniref:hypothetical protein n=1 Tax=Herbaspirillum huttiense TaxID=863372 RepID=UPI002884A970|nr:hypothetical protein [Herbaspirillum huttiense]MDT0358626.1 hypothetical protein [Herbaspirillum huttiense F1]
MKLDHFDEIDLTVALRALHKLALQEGDLGRDYWRQIAELLKDTASFRQRALLAEDKLRQARLTASPRKCEDAARSKSLSSKVRNRIAAEYSPDLARMQRVLLVADKDFQIDQIILAWHEYSCAVNLFWKTLPESDEELFSLLISAID